MVFSSTLHITDDLSGLRTPSGALDANPAILFKPVTGSGATFGITRTATLVSGNSYDGTYRLDVEVPSGTAGGSYNLLVHPIDDVAGNSSFFTTNPGVTASIAGQTPKPQVSVPTCG